MSKNYVDIINEENANFNEWMQENYPDVKFEITEEWECVDLNNDGVEASSSDENIIAPGFIYIDTFIHDYKKINEESYIMFYIVYNSHKEYEHKSKFAEISVPDDRLEKISPIYDSIERHILYMIEKNYVLDSFRVTVTNKGKIKIYDANAILQNIVKQNIDIDNKDRFKYCLKKYVEFNLEKNRNKNPDKISGWKINLYKLKTNYIGVTTNKIYGRLNSIDLFNKVKDKYIYKDYEENNLKNDLNLVLALLKNNNELIIPFLYGLLSISGSYATTKERFALCLYGNSNKFSYKIVANLFLNFFNIDNNINKLPSKSSSIVLSSILSTSKTNLYYKALLSDIPLIIYTNENRSISGNGNVKKIITDYVNRRIGYDPVFLSKGPIIYDECFNLDISNLNAPYEEYNPKDNSKLLEVKKALNLICISYIHFVKKYWQKQSRKYTEKAKQYLDHFDTVYNDLFTYIENATNDFEENSYFEFYKSLILILSIFFLYLESFGVDFETEKEDLKKILLSVHNFFYDYSDEKSNDYIDIFRDYIAKIFIEKTYNPSSYCYDYRIDSKENTPCYYLEYKKFYNDFKNKTNINISKNEFINILYKADMLVATDKEKSKVRTIKNKSGVKEKLSCLIIKKEALFPNETTQPDN